jgi:hypothetical protein
MLLYSGDIIIIIIIIIIINFALVFPLFNDQ